MKSFIGDNP